LVQRAETKIVLLVMDGLGSLAEGKDGKSALEAARTLYLDGLAAQGICGLHGSVRRDDVSAFGETACLHGGLGPRFPATDLLSLALAHARRLRKLGA
jgi:2,3-bisphosphoglycerate-independent phosphoglycerate mutase